MLHVFVERAGALRWAKEAADGVIPPETRWIDLVYPTTAETARASGAMGVTLPTRMEIVEIEESSRLRVVDGPGGAVVTLTASVLALADTGAAKLTPIAFVFAGGRLATLHFVDAQPFLDLRRKVVRAGLAETSADQVFATLIDTVIERAAAMLHRFDAALERANTDTFLALVDRRVAQRIDNGALLRTIGRGGHLVGKARHSLSDVVRMLDFVARGRAGAAFGPIGLERVRAARDDAASLLEYVEFLSKKIALFLDAALGQVNVEQTEIIKVVSVLSAVLLPPLLVSSIYGMNFKETMPELHVEWAYPVALVAMVLAAALPMLYVKRKGWW